MGISIQNISKSYDEKTVLQNFSLELRDGGIYCLMGPSGVGKTTLLRILMGLEQADCGDRTFDAEENSTETKRTL